MPAYLVGSILIYWIHYKPFCVRLGKCTNYWFQNRIGTRCPTVLYCILVFLLGLSNRRRPNTKIRKYWGRKNNMNFLIPTAIAGVSAALIAMKR